MKIKIHFEIGKKLEPLINGKTQTTSVFKSNSLKECIKEFKDKKYNLKDYFIDVWETRNNGFPIPIADIKIESWIFN